MHLGGQAAGEGLAWRRRVALDPGQGGRGALVVEVDRLQIEQVLEAEGDADCVIAQQLRCENFMSANTLAMASAAAMRLASRHVSKVSVLKHDTQMPIILTTAG